MHSVDNALNHETQELKFFVADNAQEVWPFLDLIKKTHDESHLGHIKFSESKTISIVHKAIADKKRNGIFLAERKGVPVGFLYCTIGEYFIGTGSLITTVNSMGVARRTRRSLNGGRVALGLISGLESWSRARASSEILFHVTSGNGVGRTHKFLKRRGFTLLGGSYSRRLDP